MFVVSDTSPIINLAAIGRADLLESLYGTLVIPPAVGVELISLPQKYARFAAIARPPFVRVEQPPDNPDVRALQAALALSLHPGEIEAIVLAVACHADLLLVDELAARRLARQHGVATQGLLGILVEGKRRGLLSAVAPLLERLRIEAGFWVGEELRARVLRSVGEQV